MAVALCLLARPQEKRESSLPCPPRQTLHMNCFPYVVGMPKPLALTPGSWGTLRPPPRHPCPFLVVISALHAPGGCAMTRWMGDAALGSGGPGLNLPLMLT